jgi:hypothetical protein
MKKKATGPAKARTDEDYVRLDDAIGTVDSWREEIEAELNKAGHSEKTLAVVIAAMNRVHSPEEDT